MRQRNTLILAALLVLLGAYVYFIEIPSKEKGQSERLFNFKGDEVAAIALSYPQQEIQLQKESSGAWKLIQPLQAAADGSTVGSLLSALATSDVKRTLEKKPTSEDLKSFGLDPPAVKVSITLKSGLTLPTLLVGAKTPLGDSTYVERGSDPSVYLTGAEIMVALEKQPNDFRDKTILPFPEQEIARLEVQTPEQSLILTKGEKEQWMLDAPVKKNVKTETVADYVATLTQLRAKAFVDDQPTNLKKYGLDHPAMKVSIEGKDGKNLGTVQIGSKSDDTYYAKREGDAAVYAIDESSYKLLRKQPADFAAEEKRAPEK